MKFQRRYLVKATPAIPTAAEGIQPIRPPVAIPSGWGWLWVVLLLLLVLGAIAWWWWKQKRKKASEAPTVQIPPEVRAREKLRQALTLMDQPKPFTIFVSNAARVYLEERFDLRAPERTTEEFLSELQASHKLSVPHKTLLADFLRQCDLVKFARYEPGPNELQALYDAALRLIDETCPHLPVDLQAEHAQTPEPHAVA
jgi:hypothetical protein